MNLERKDRAGKENNMVTQIRPLRSSTPTAPDRSMGFRTAWINLLADLEATCLLPPTYPAAKTPQPRYVTQGIERSVRRR